MRQVYIYIRWLAEAVAWRPFKLEVAMRNRGASFRRWGLVALSVLLAMAFAGCQLLLGATTTTRPPVADAGGDQADITLGQTVTLDGSNSTGTSITYAWTLTVPPGSKAKLSSKTVKSPTFKPDLIGVYTATITVSDSKGNKQIKVPNINC